MVNGERKEVSWFATRMPQRSPVNCLLFSCTDQMQRRLTLGAMTSRQLLHIHKSLFIIRNYSAPLGECKDS